ncbi:hypothetical protein HOG21_08435 [bacterium]|nr:hypothetical protein [bacterium]
MLKLYKYIYITLYKMKTFSKIALIFLLLFSFTTSAVYTANDPSNAEMNLQT